MSQLRTIIGLALVAALALPGAALAGPYPPPSKPSTTQKAPKGPFHTLTVCKHGCKYATIQSAVNKAKAGDTVKVKSGTYREGVTVLGASKRYLKLVGNPKDPSKVVLDGSQGNKVPRQNGVRVDGANQVTINGFTSKHYNGNGFYVVNVSGYELNHLNATLSGVYGIYAFNSLGGVMENSQASYNSDSGFYIGQTPKQTTPERSIVRNVKAFGNVLGFSGTNMRYVTITKSQWFNNGDRHRPQRAGHREVRAAGGQRHHRQRHLLEQLQLLRRRAVQAEEAGDGHAVPGRRRRPALRRSPHRGQPQPHLRQLPGRGRGPQADPAQAGRRCRPHRQPGPRQPVRARRGRPQRPRAVLRRQRVRQLLRPQRRRARPRRRPTARRSPRARSPGRTRSARRPRTRPSAGTSAIPPTRRSGSSTPTPPRAASRRWSTTRSEGPDRDRADRRRGSRRGAGRGRLAAARPARPRRRRSRSSTTSTTPRS